MQKYTRLAKKDDLSEIMRIIADAKDFLEHPVARNGKTVIPMNQLLWMILRNKMAMFLLLEIRLLALRQQLQELNPLIKQSMVVGAMIMILIVQFIGSVLVPTFRVKV